MKININSKTRESVWGGGNQFLKALRVEIINAGFYAESLNDADAVLFNGYQEILSLIKFWFIRGNRKIIYRLGPVMSLHRKAFKWKIVDYVMVWIANLLADAVIFQSKWSYMEALKFGFSKNKKYAVVLNAVDDLIFYSKEFKEKNHGEKIKLIYTSWSTNEKKGFQYLKFLDENLDFNKYEMTFVGNSPFKFKNIKMIEAMPSQGLSLELRKNDIFISPVKDDACSNALIEALASGLPAVCLKSGGNPEIVGLAGELFTDKLELIPAIENVSENLSFYRNNISIKSLKDVALEYLSVARSL